jgi:hypothetical protein
MEAADVLKLVASSVAGGGVTSIAGALEQGLKLVNHLTQDDPVKQAKASRQYLMQLLTLAREVRESVQGSDVSDIVTAYYELLDSM